MQRKHNTALVPAAKKLRREMTPEERHLWYDFLRDYPAGFRRQKILGKYIADFYCAKAKVVIELDGSQHYEPSGAEHDRIRSEFLAAYDLLVLRFANNDVMRNFRGVCEKIDGVVSERLQV